MSRIRHSCICLTCGVRNDHSHPDGFCQNGHDDWLEYRDVIRANETFERAKKVFGTTEPDLTALFTNPNIKQIEIV